MAPVPGLRSPHDQVGRIVYFGRMLDKMRLHAAGRLPPEYVPNLGEAVPRNFDARCCAFLRVRYEDLKARVLAGAGDEEALAWAEAEGGRRTDAECEWWNGFMVKLGWRDSRSEVLRQRIREFGLEGRRIDTMFEMLDADEGRAP
jgi:gluconokinase